MPVRSLLAVVLVAAMAGFGFGVYHLLGNLRSSALTHKVRAPHHTQGFTLGGTLVIEQGGALYRLKQGTFSQIATGGWMQPAVTPDHRNLIAVKRGFNSSDLYELNLNGQVERQLTNDGSSTVENNHWAFYPNVSPDGGTLFYSWDQKDPYNNFRVDLSVFAQPLAGSQGQADAWTVPNNYTGGDVQPANVAGGGIVYSKYDISDQGLHFSQLWLTTQAMSTGQALTAPQDDCSQPAVSPDGNKVAMICTSGGQVARLEVASLINGVLGTPAVVTEGTIADPAWGPDGNSLVYLSAVPPDGTFQLFYANLATPPAPKPKAAASARSGEPAASPTASAAPTPYPPKQLTVDNDFDATSAPVWFG